MSTRPDFSVSIVGKTIIRLLCTACNCVFAISSDDLFFFIGRWGYRTFSRSYTIEVDDEVKISYTFFFSFEKYILYYITMYITFDFPAGRFCEQSYLHTMLSID